MHRLVPLVALVALLALPPAALGAEPAPFGHACALKDGVRFCPTTDLAQRVASFDGVPLDVDVTLPATGDGPFPTIVMLHGYGGDKRSFEAATAPDALPGTTLYHYNTNYFAARGFAVVTTSARGFGHSCGKSDPAEPACASGWLHLADQRYELRDTQTLLGLLVDQGITKLDAIGVTGISYGGGQSLQLALLGDRVRLPDGSFAPWRSPAGKPLRLEAAYPRWPWSDLVSALEPNGRFRDFDLATRLDALTPIGVSIQSYTTALYAISGRLAPPGVDPTADLTTWNARIAQGEPYGADVRAAAGELHDYHGAAGLLERSFTGREAALLIQNGWTDDLFPVGEALRVYNWLRHFKPRAYVTLQLGALGHSRGAVKANVETAFNDEGAAFFAAHLQGTGSAPRPGSVRAFTQTCPKEAPGGGPFTATSWARLHPGAVRFGGARAQTVSSTGGNPLTALGFDPIASPDACKTVSAVAEPGTAGYTLADVRGFTLLGRTTITATIATRGAGGQLVGRLWDVAPGGQQLLIDRGNYRLLDDQRGRIVFQLHGNGYRVRKGHTVKLQLLGRDAPYYRPSNGAFTVRLTRVSVELPTRERPRRALGIVKPSRSSQGCVCGG